jgi:hypothetical protein
VLFRFPVQTPFAVESENEGVFYDVWRLTRLNLGWVEREQPSTLDLKQAKSGGWHLALFHASSNFTVQFRTEHHLGCHASVRAEFTLKELASYAAFFINITEFSARVIKKG